MLFVTKSTIAMLIAGLVLSPAGAEAQSALAGAANQSTGPAAHDPSAARCEPGLGERVGSSRVGSVDLTVFPA